MMIINLKIEIMENLSEMSVEQIREEMNKRYPYVHCEDVSDEMFETFAIGRDLGRYSLDMQFDCLYDYLLSQNLCDVTE